MPEPIQLRVLSVVEETAEAKSFRLQVPDSLAYRPGQFLTIGIPSDHGMVARCYSMSSAPHEDDITITVKRTPNGFASNWLCDHLESGHTVTALPPSGNFTPPAAVTGLLLFAAGSGVTPVMSIAKSVLTQGSTDIVLFYANRDSASVIFADELRDLTNTHPDRLHVVHWLEALQSLPTHNAIKRFASGYCDYHSYTCGPAPFMNTVAEALTALDIPADRIKREVFQSLSGNPFETTDTAQVTAYPTATTSRVRGSHRGVNFDYDDWPADTPLLQFLLSKGVDAPFSCRSGECSACTFRLVDGAVEMARNDVLDSTDLADGYRLACQATPKSESITITYD